MAIAPPQPPLRDETVLLVPLDGSHVGALEALGTDPLVQRFTRVPSAFGREDAERWLRTYEQGWRDGSRAGFAVTARDGGRFLGVAAFVALSLAGREAEVGYVVVPAERRRGVASRALALLTGWGLGTLGLARIELRADVENPASLRVAERCGYRREGTLRSVHVKDGRRADMALYARTAATAGRDG